MGKTMGKKEGANMDRITQEILNSVKKCSCCGKVQKVKDMKFHGIQNGTDKMAFDLALFNCVYKSTQCIQIPKKK